VPLPYTPSLLECTGLQFDDEGMPIMPNMVRVQAYTKVWDEILTGAFAVLVLQGAGMFPGMAGMPGMPRK
jgi:hypothetical protein